MKTLYTFLLIIVLQIKGYSQISLQDSTIHENVVLDFKKINKGIIMPYMNKSTRGTLETDTATPNGLFVFDTEDNHFYYFIKNSNCSPPSPCGKWVYVTNSNDIELMTDTLDGLINILSNKNKELLDSIQSMAFETGWIEAQFLANSIVENYYPNKFKLSYKRDRFNNLYIKGCLRLKQLPSSGQGFLSVFLLPQNFIPTQYITHAIVYIEYFNKDVTRREIDSYISINNISGLVSLGLSASNYVYNSNRMLIIPTTIIPLK